MILQIMDPNYCATIVRVKSLVPLKGLDNLLGLSLFGFTCLVPKETQIGELGVLFTAETQLSEEFASNNNLFRHSEKNINKEKVGYIDDSGRVRCLALRSHISSGLFLPLSSLSYLGDISLLKEGDCFNFIGKNEVCRKYIIRKQNSLGGPKQSKNRDLRKARIDGKLMPEHVSTSHYLKCEDMIDDEIDLVKTVKLHGCSFRIAYQLCYRPLTIWEKWLKWFGFKIQEYEYDYFSGSRRIIKDLKRKDLIHYYDLDIWNQTLEKYKHIIPKSTVLLGELVGWAGDKPIQKHYTYQIPKGTFETYIYRIITVNPDGYSVDWGWDHVKEFCINNGIKHVPELWRGKKKDLDVNKYQGKKFRQDLGLLQCLPLDSEAPCDEGIVLRQEGIQAKFYKYKSDAFRLIETKGLDAGEVDMESAE